MGENGSQYRTLKKRIMIVMEGGVERLLGGRRARPYLFLDLHTFATAKTLIAPALDTSRMFC